MPDSTSSTNSISALQATQDTMIYNGLDTLEYDYQTGDTTDAATVAAWLQGALQELIANGDTDPYIQQINTELSTVLTNKIQFSSDWVSLKNNGAQGLSPFQTWYQTIFSAVDPSTLSSSDQYFTLSYYNQYASIEPSFLEETGDTLTINGYMQMLTPIYREYGQPEYPSLNWTNFMTTVKQYFGSNPPALVKTLIHLLESGAVPESLQSSNGGYVVDDVPTYFSAVQGQQLPPTSSTTPSTPTSSSSSTTPSTSATTSSTPTSPSSSAGLQYVAEQIGQIQAYVQAGDISDAWIILQQTENNMSQYPSLNSNQSFTSALQSLITAAINAAAASITLVANGDPIPSDESLTFTNFVQIFANEYLDGTSIPQYQIGNTVAPSGLQVSVSSPNGSSPPTATITFSATVPITSTLSNTILGNLDPNNYASTVSTIPNQKNYNNFITNQLIRIKNDIYLAESAQQNPNLVTGATTNGDFLVSASGGTETLSPTQSFTVTAPDGSTVTITETHNSDGTYSATIENLPLSYFNYLGVSKSLQETSASSSSSSSGSN